VRRQSTTVGCIEIITTVPSKDFDNSAVRKFLIIQSSKKEQTPAHTLEEIPVLIYHTNKELYYYDQFIRTGNENHVKKVQSNIITKHPYASEEGIYTKAKLSYTLPEMRKDVAEWDFKKDNDELVTVEDIKGVVHNHTTWSDGIDSLNDFVNACRNLKYEYVVISDHSKNAHYASGLKEEKVLKQMIEIDKLNKKLAPFQIFKSIECDILVSGDLDYGGSVETIRSRYYLSTSVA
jgi:DNA polymerase (family 10)